MSNLRCPVHLLTDQTCGSWCERARLEFERSSAALEAYWRTRYQQPKPVLSDRLDYMARVVDRTRGAA